MTGRGKNTDFVLEKHLKCSKVCIKIWSGNNLRVCERENKQVVPAVIELSQAQSMTTTIYNFFINAHMLNDIKPDETISKKVISV